MLDSEESRRRSSGSARNIPPRRPSKRFATLRLWTLRQERHKVRRKGLAQLCLLHRIAANRSNCAPSAFHSVGETGKLSSALAIVHDSCDFDILRSGGNRGEGKRLRNRWCEISDHYERRTRPYFVEAPLRLIGSNFIQSAWPRIRASTRPIECASWVRLVSSTILRDGLNR
jgi:hypothetical protein